MRKLLTALLLSSASLFAQSAAHSANLKWTPSVDALQNPNIVANVYRADGPCPSSGNPTGSVLISSTLAGAAAYTDTSIVAGKSYCWTVTASTNGVESVPSNAAGGVVPLAPHTALTVNVK